MKLIELIELNRKLSQVKHLQGKELNYVIEKNIAKLKIDIDILVKQEKEIVDMSKDFLEEVQVERVVAATVDGELKTRDENGVKMYDISGDRLASFEEKFSDLKVKYKDILEEQEKSYADFQEMLKEKDSDFQISKVKFHCVPDNISSEDMKLIFQLIQEKES